MGKTIYPMVRCGGDDQFAVRIYSYVMMKNLNVEI
jgi:hypothetical protein